MMKNCVISAVGKDSLHKEWISGECNFDLHLVVYDESYDDFVGDTPYVCFMKGYKLKVVYHYLQTHPDVLDAYEYFFVPDDDISMDSSCINSLFDMMSHYGLRIAQPALVNSYYLWGHTLKDPYSVLRYTNFVEMMVPCFSREALGKVLFTFNENETGWGTETHWPLLIHASPNDMAVIDAVSVVHTRPIRSGQSIHRHDAMEYLRKYGLATQVMEYGYVSVGGGETFLLDRETYGTMADLLRKQLPKVFCSDSFGMDGYGGYICLLCELGKITQSKLYTDAATRILVQSSQCNSGSHMNPITLNAYFDGARKCLAGYLESCLSLLGRLSPIAQAYDAYRCFCSNKEISCVSKIRHSLGLIKRQQPLSFQEQLMLAEILLNNQIQVNENSDV